MTLSKSFVESFIATFERRCAQNEADFRSCWTNSTAWTALMLRNDDALFVDAAKSWAQTNLGDDASVHREWRKLDLMVVSPKLGESGEWWKTTPVLILEHENNDDTYVEAWNLACWRSALKVLITYHQNESILASKLKHTGDILSAFDGRFCCADTEFLFLSAPRTFGPRLAWEGYDWREGSWHKLI